MADRKQTTTPPDVSQKPQPPPKPPERKRTAFEFIRELLRVGEWYYSAIELDPYVENPQNGGSLRREAEEIVLSEATRRVNEDLEDDYIQGGKTYDLVNLMSGAVPMMPVPRCETCRWWERVQGERNGLCQYAMKWPQGKIRGEDVITDSDFGCVQWEGKL